MDVDALRRCPTAAIELCYWCKEPGHIAKDCPQRFDVRFLTIDEKREWMENLMAEVDAHEATASVATEDFHDSSE